ncbi:MAG: hypothetical protein OEV59_01125 [Deltaproteobacteria bacterium]|nr:hypothetical protein [Deltaproteobacteria bacterium]
MSRKLITLAIMLTTVCIFSGCAPQTKEEFIKAAKSPSAVIYKAKELTIDRPASAVVADLKNHLDACFKNVRAVHVSTDPRTRGTSVTDYHLKTETAKDGTFSFSLQEDRAANAGAAPGGFFSIVGEIKAADKNKTNLNLYSLRLQGDNVESIENAAKGKGSICPKL